MVAKKIALPIHTRGFRPAHEYTIMFKLAEGDYYHVPATQVQQICPELEAAVDKAVKDGSAMTHVFEVPRELEGQWKDWWTVNDYIVQGCELTAYEPISSFLTDAHVYMLAARYNHHAGAEAAAAATQARAVEILDCVTDTESTFDQHVALFHLESLIAAAQLASSCGVDWMTRQQPFSSTTTNTEGSRGGVVIGGGDGEPGSPMGLGAMVVAACVTLGPLLAELPALRGAVFEDAGFTALWERVSSGSGGAVPGWFTPGVRERMRRVIEGREIEDSVWWCTP